TNALRVRYGILQLSSDRSTIVATNVAPLCPSLDAATRRAAPYAVAGSMVWPSVDVILPVAAPRAPIVTLPLAWPVSFAAARIGAAVSLDRPYVDASCGARPMRRE